MAAGVPKTATTHSQNTFATVAACRSQSNDRMQNLLKQQMMTRISQLGPTIRSKLYSTRGPGGNGSSFPCQLP